LEGSIGRRRGLDRRAHIVIRRYPLAAVPQRSQRHKLGSHARLSDARCLPLSQAVTGAFLALYYRPDASGGAYESIRYITADVFLGQFVRGMHKWGASVMIIVIFLHMGRVFLFGAYKYPRELTWIIGVTLLLLVLIMGFTGYLLPFDQRSYWGTIVGVNINSTAPLLGPYLSDFLRGGPEFGATTLSRFYAIHMILIPGAIVILISVHLYLVAKLGTTAPPWTRAGDRPEVDMSSEA
jgi:ubiquinol-cytochrome c reductase cytochrome b subunit/menaquinol-cytochrome c reductase cytochrome b subunit